MQVISWQKILKAFLADQSLCGFSAITVGSFDGIHLGHQVLLDEVLSQPEVLKGVVTFSRPTRLKKSKNYAGDILTTRLKLKMLEDLGFDFVILIDFSKEFSKTTGLEFFKILVKTIQMKALVVGKDFSCGFQHSTNILDIEKIAKDYSFTVKAIDRIFLNGENISSSSIRNAIQNADFSFAKKLLGHSFLLDLLDVHFKSILPFTFYAPVSAFTQVLPKKSKVTVILKNGKRVKAYFSVVDKTVYLELNSTKAINFKSQKNNECFDYLEF